jgi:adenosylcobinamide-phosphate synthase
VGFLVDLLVGDPHGLPHPVCFIGRLISGLEAKLRREGSVRNPKDTERRGTLLVVLVLLVTGVLAFGILALAYLLHPAAGVLVETVMTWQILAVKSLRVESMEVYHCLVDKGLPEARHAVSMIVGRDTEQLDEEGVIKAAVETVAENTSDGVIAPMLYLALGGPVAGFLYKAVNTMDSMIGYKNEKYLYFGRSAARLDDVVNYLPARISAGLMIAVCVVAGREFDAALAGKIHKRDCHNHASPNSAQTESVCAGALGIRLAGDACYFGKKVEKPYIGDALREVEPEDICRANRLMYLTAGLCQLICLILMGGALWLM